MLKLIKKFFQKEPEVIEEVKKENLQEWLKKEIAELNFNHNIKNHLQQIKEIKLQLEEKVKILKEQEISEKEQKQVEERVKNIVLGHKDHYAAEIERFTQSLSFPEKDNFTTIDDHKEALQFNENLDNELNLLAKRTAKSYQAAQHLFFDHVENLFKLLGELNKTVKEFETRVKDEKIKELEGIKETIKILNYEIEKKKDLEKEIEEKGKKIKLRNEEKQKEEQKFKELIESNEYKEFLKLKEEEEGLNKQIKDTEYEIFSFFSKLNKPLKKYERIALDNKIIKRYLDNGVKAFKQDAELEIILALSSLKKSLDSLQFDEKQKNNFTNLIEKSKQGYLEELAVKMKKLDREKRELNKKIESNEIIKKIENKEKEIKEINFKIENVKTESSNLQSTLGKLNLEKNKKEIVENVKDILGKKINLTSSFPSTSSTS